jgi:hypothetical protein
LFTAGTFVFPFGVGAHGAHPRVDNGYSAYVGYAIEHDRIIVTII